MIAVEILNGYSNYRQHQREIANFMWRYEFGRDGLDVELMKARDQRSIDTKYIAFTIY